MLVDATATSPTDVADLFVDVGRMRCNLLRLTHVITPAKTYSLILANAISLTAEVIIMVGGGLPTHTW